MGSTPDHGTPSHIPTAPIVFIYLGDLLITVDGSKLCIGNLNEQYYRYTLPHTLLGIAGME